MLLSILFRHLPQAIAFMGSIGTVLFAPYLMSCVCVFMHAFRASLSHEKLMGGCLESELSQYVYLSICQYETMGYIQVCF